MAKIKDSKPKELSGGYVRLFDDERLGILMSQVQSTVIRNGTELEKLINKKARGVDDLEQALTCPWELPKGVYLVPKKAIKKCKRCSIQIVDASGDKIKLPEPDFLLLQIKRNPRCTVLELKDGHVFDTKKSQAEKDSLVLYSEKLGARIPYSTDFRICCFNQDDPEEICRGLKNIFSQDEVMTGRQLCGLLDIDYDGILQERTEDAKENRKYLFKRLFETPAFRKYIKKHLLKEAEEQGRGKDFQRHLEELF